MIRNFFPGCVACVIILFSYNYSSGQTIDSTVSVDGRSNVVNTAVPFLRITPDARSGAMGDAGIAISPDANSTYWNLSKLPFAEKDAAASVTYTPWLTQLVNDVFLADLSGYKKIDDNQAIGASLRYFSLGTVQFTDIYGNDQGQFHPREFAFDAGYSRKLSDNFGLGIALRYIYSNLASGASTNGETYKAGQAVAGDVSFFYTNTIDYNSGGSGTWSFGATLTNVGNKISYTNSSTDKNFLPTNLGLGSAYTAQIDELNKITFALDLNKLLVPTPPSPNDSLGLINYSNIGVVDGMFKSFSAPGGFQQEMQQVTYSIGAEYWYNDLFAVRAGYFHESKYDGNRQYFEAGLGLKYNSFGINFSYLIPSGSGVEQNPLSNTLRFSLLFDFDQNQ
jgi:Type IX secretion system protein PorV